MLRVRNLRVMSVKRTFQARKTPEAVGEIALLLTATTGLASTTTYAASGNLGDAAALTLVYVAFAIWIGFRWTRPVVQPPKPTKTFRPFEDLDPKSAWPRPDDVEHVLRAIVRKRENLPVIVGESGVGKSVLMNVLVREKIDTMSHPPELRIFEAHHYATLVSRLEELQETASVSKPVVLVLDQFEEWLAYVKTLSDEDRAEEFAGIQRVLTAAMHSNAYTIVLSLRTEWYYELRGLGSLVPAPDACCHIEGARVDQAGDRPNALPRDQGLRMASAIHRSFLDVLKDPTRTGTMVELLGRSGRISPLEAQIVGATVERAAEEDGFDIAALVADGIEDAVASFFDAILSGAKHRVLTMKVLCALSTRTQLRVQMARQRLETILFADKDEIGEAIEYLVKQKLIAKRGNELELAHDSIAAYFNRASVGLLSSIERDSVFVHAESSVIRNDVFRPRKATPLRLGTVFPVALLAFMTVRLVYCGMTWNLFGPNFQQPAFRSVLDLAYIPTFLAEGAWIVYVALMYDRLLDHLRETPPARRFSIFVLLNMGLWAIVGAVSAASWPLTLAFGGTPLAVKIMLLARREDLNPASRRQLRLYGAITGCVAIFFLLIGAADWYFSSVVVHERGHDATWLTVNSSVALLVSAMCLVLGPVQASRRGISLLKSLIARPNGSAHRLPVGGGYADFRSISEQPTTTAVLDHAR
jgi:hypothetical protein